MVVNQATVWVKGTLGVCARLSLKLCFLDIYSRVQKEDLVASAFCLEVFFIVLLLASTVVAETFPFWDAILSC